MIRKSEPLRFIPPATFRHRREMGEIALTAWKLRPPLDVAGSKRSQHARTEKGVGETFRRYPQAEWTVKAAPAYSTP